MALLDLDVVKRHLRVFHDDEDTEIAVYQAAAESIVVEYLDRVVLADGEELPDGDETAIHVTPAITAAILLMVGEMYEKRQPEATESEAVLPRPVRALLAPWRVWRLVEE